MNRQIIDRGRLRSGQSFYLKKLTVNYLHDILKLQQIVEQTVEGASFLQPLTTEEYNYILSGKGSMIGIFIHDQLVAFRAMLIPNSKDPEHLGRDLGLLETEWSKIIYSEISIVHPTYRGNRLQNYMGKQLFKQVDKRIFHYIAATVAPFNIPSIKDKLALGMKISALKAKYNGKLRYILIRDLHIPPDYNNYTTTKIVNMQDINLQKNLLEAGYCGIAIQKRNGNYDVTYVK
ncbi:hypothetical protein [Virgibacillus proomii]|jgi:hypothetical protein|uniref:hypothetical protein n=1 Tax=Virgibacillus proomii TaxID=84407 RepID=UPI000984E70E|nr:hypothetical protein [Virgibacillus proomii]